MQLRLRSSRSALVRLVGLGGLVATLASFPALAQSRAYVTNSSGSSVSVVDTPSDTVLGTISAGNGPSSVAVTRDGSRAYVANSGSSSITVIETLAGAVVSTIPLSGSPGSIAVTPDGQQLYVVMSNGDLQVIDVAQGTVLTTISVGTYSGGVAITPDGTRAWVATGAVTVIDTATRTIVDTLTAGTSAIDLAISPDGTRVLVTAIVYSFSPVFSAGGEVVTFDAVTRAVVATTWTYSVPDSIAISPDGSRAWVGLVSTWSDTGYGAGFLPARAVSVIDTTSHLVVGWMPVTSRPAGMAVETGGAHVLVTMPSSNAIAVIDASTMTVLGDVTVGASPGGIATFDLPVAGTPFCFGDGSGTACPCGNGGAIGAGCVNSLGSGARLSTTGAARIGLDTLVLHGSLMPNGTALYFQGTTRANGGAGAVFGDGLRCAGGQIARLGEKVNSGGASQWPGSGDAAISVGGSVNVAGSVRTYQVWYRNAAAFCQPETFNLSNGVEVTWAP